MLFVEGILRPYVLIVTWGTSIAPMACLVGDYNNVFALRQVRRSGAISLKTRHEQRCAWDRFPEQHRQALLSLGPGADFGALPAALSFGK